MWSHRGKNIWWTPLVLTAENKNDPTSPKLTMVEAISIFKILEEAGLIFPFVQRGQTVFLLHESKTQEWDAFIEHLQKQENSTPPSPSPDGRQGSSDNDPSTSSKEDDKRN